MLGLGLIDWIVIVFYLLGITFIGLWAMRKVRSSASFFIGDRKFGKVMMSFFMFGEVLGWMQLAGMATAVAGVALVTKA